jgi:hypothetical protein
MMKNIASPLATGANVINIFFIVADNSEAIFLVVSDPSMNEL